MQQLRTYRLLILIGAIVIVIGCAKKNAEKPAAKAVKDSASMVKDSSGSPKDSLAAASDSSAAGKDSAAVVKDSAALAKDSTRVADSLALHPPPMISYEARQGQYVYAKYCAVCHGVEGKADGFNTFNLDPKPRDFTEPDYLKKISDDRLIQIIRDGGRGANKSPLMPPYMWTLDKNDISYVAAFVRTFTPPDSSKK